MHELLLPATLLLLPLLLLMPLFLGGGNEIGSFASGSLAGALKFSAWPSTTLLLLLLLLFLLLFLLLPVVVQFVRCGLMKFSC